MIESQVDLGYVLDHLLKVGLKDKGVVQDCEVQCEYEGKPVYLKLAICIVDGKMPEAK